MSAPRRHLPALGAMERNDCTTCALSTMATGARMDTASLSRLTTTALRVSHWIESASAGKVTPLTLDVSGRGVSLLLRGDADAFVAAIGTLHGSTAAEDLVWRAELATITVEWHVICADLSMDGVRIGFSIGSSSAPAWLLARCPRPAEQVAA